MQFIGVCWVERHSIIIIIIYFIKRLYIKYSSECFTDCEVFLNYKIIYNNKVYKISTSKIYVSFLGN